MTAAGFDLRAELPAVAQAFGHDDTHVQERALKLVERHLGAVPAQVRDEVAHEAQRLSAGLRLRAAPFLGPGETDQAPEPYLRADGGPARFVPARRPGPPVECRAGSGSGRMTSTGPDMTWARRETTRPLSAWARPGRSPERSPRAKES